MLRPRAIELLSCSLLLLPMLFYPLARDQGLFAYAGQVVLDGGVPYADVYEQKGPATHYTFATIMALTGGSTIGIRFFFFVLGLAGTQLAAMIAEKLRDASARLPCALCYAVVCSFALPRGPWTKGQVEDIQLPLSLAIVLLIGNAEKYLYYRYLSVVSLLLGIACVYKPTAVLLSAVIALYVGGRLVMDVRLPKIQVFYRLLTCTACFVAPALFFAGVLALQGAFDDCWLFVVEHNANVYSRLQSGDLGKWLRVIGGNWGGVVFLALFSLRHGYRHAPQLWQSLWLVIIAGLLVVFWQWKFFIYYHWTPFVGALSIVSGLTIARLLTLASRLPIPEQFVPSVRIAVVLAGLTIAATQPWHVVQTHFAVARVVFGVDQISDFRDPYLCGTETSRVNRITSDYIRSVTSPSDKVLVWGYDVILNVLSDRRAPTRFAMNRVLMRRISPRCDEWRAEFIRDVKSTPPKMIVIVDEPPRVWFLGNPRELLREFPEFNTFLQENYSADRTMGHFTLYKLQSPNDTTHHTATTFHGETCICHELR